MSVSLGIVFLHGSIRFLPQVLNLITVSATAVASALLKRLFIPASFPLISRLSWEVPSACASCFCLLLANDIKHFGVQFALIRQKQKLPRKNTNKHWKKLCCVRQWLLWSLVLITIDWGKKSYCASSCLTELFLQWVKISSLSRQLIVWSGACKRPRFRATQRGVVSVHVA